MLLSFLVHTHSLRWVVPATVMMGSAPCFISAWGVLRVLTAALPRRVYIAADSRLYSLYQRLVLSFFNTYTGVQVLLYGDKDALTRGQENVIFICNHQSTVDWVVANMLAAPQGSIGSIKYILKDGLKFFPLYGLYFRQHGCVYVKRSGKYNQNKTERQIRELKQNNVPTWLVIFPEGTRFNPELPEVISKSKQFARDQGFEEFQQVLTPKLKAFQTCLLQLQGHVDAVYDVTIAYSNTQDDQSGERLVAPGMPEFLVGKSKELHLHLERVPVSDIPLDESGMKTWIFRRFQLKERLMAHFYSTRPEEAGKFPGEGSVLEIKRRQTLPAFLIFGSCLTLVLGTSQGRSLYWKVAVFGTLGGCLWMSVRS